jgi:hypothetical protein
VEGAAALLALASCHGRNPVVSKLIAPQKQRKMSTYKVGSRRSDIVLRMTGKAQEKDIGTLNSLHISSRDVNAPTAHDARTSIALVQ